MSLSLGLGAAIFLLAMMLVTTVDVAGRYLFATPLPGAFELTQLLLAATVFAGLPLVTLKEEHVSVTLLSERLKGRAAALHGALSSALSAAVFIVVARQLGVQAMRLASYGDTTSLLRIPMAPLAWTMSVLAGLTAFILVALAVSHLLGAIRGRR
ncbi:TRAP transporter small permease [Lutibaculum baratangense]|uniref:TRAP transporter small permease n=1 Tax=Lutibaculum baratangense TaxID=1358440 RepID=UPI0012688BA2|nr:TRAP transporter small permease [Lutibaculum baratangense]